MVIKGNIRLLVIEDDVESQKIFTKLLREYNLYFCESESSMYTALMKFKIDLILMDIGLPGNKDGLTLIKDLKENQNYSSIPIISFTSHAYSQQKNNVLKAGADGYITKPLSKNDLINMIDTLLNINEDL
jgi:osomolarity two-component system sensor histidine kinase NIK1